MLVNPVYGSGSGSSGGLDTENCILSTINIASSEINGTAYFPDIYNAETHEIPEKAFYEAECLLNVTIPKNTKILRKHCFYKSGMTSINLEETKVEVIEDSSMSQCHLTTVVFPSTLKTLGSTVVHWTSSSNNPIRTIFFKGTPELISGRAFWSQGNITDIYVPWSNGKVAGAPWGATNATIHYNYTG